MGLFRENVSMSMKKAEDNLWGLGFLKRDKEKVVREGENAEFKEIKSLKSEVW